MKTNSIISLYFLLQPHVTCQKFQKDITQNPNLYDEINKYKSTSDYLAVSFYSTVLPNLHNILDYFTS